ncbi:zinc finger, CCHC-type containing protein [Tanacetum coccineum]
MSKSISKSRQAYNVMTNNINHLKEIVDQAWVKHSNDRLHLRNPTAQDMEILIKICLMPLALKTQNDSFAFICNLQSDLDKITEYNAYIFIKSGNWPVCIKASEQTEICDAEEDPFLLTTLKVVYVLTTPMPELLEDATVEAIRIREKWENDDYICRGHILNDDLSLVQLGSHLRIEESLRAQEQETRQGKEDCWTFCKTWQKRVKIRKTNKTKERNVISKNTVVVRVPTRNLSWNVGSAVRLVTSRGIAVVVIRRTQMLVVRERGLRTIPKTKVDAITWWIDSGATTHVCKDRCWFKTYEPVEDGSVLYMGDDHFAPVHGKDLVIITMCHQWPFRKNRGQGGRAPLRGQGAEPLAEVPLPAQPTIQSVRLSDPKRKTLGGKGIDCIFVGYAEHSKAYRFYVIEPIFDDNRFSSIPRPNDIIPNSDESQRDDHSDDVPSEIPEPRKEAIDDEIDSIMENNTWVLSDLPPGCKLLGCKWIFKIKMKVNGTIDKFNARLVIQGFRQKEWIDYFDTYAPVARITTIRLLLALAAIHNLPEGFVMPDQNQVDKTKKFLSSRFSMKDIGKADVILGIKIKRENKGILITQSHYIKKILKKFNRIDCSSVSTPMDPVKKLKPNTGKPVDQLKYSRAIGCLMYAMTSTRSDIAYAVGRLSRFASNPSRQHWQAITSVFKYLKGTMNYGLSYVGYPSILEGYSDASWINHVEDSSSMSGWVFLLGGVPFHGLPRSNHASLVLLWNLSARTKMATYVNIKFCRFKKLGLGFLGVKEKQVLSSDNYGGTLNDAILPKEAAAPSVSNEPVAIEMQYPVVDKSYAVDSDVGSYPPLPTQDTTPASNSPGKSSYANLSGKPSGKKLNIRTFSMEGLDAMLENGPWFIRNNPLILKKWNPDENLLKEDVRTVLVWVKLYGVPVTTFSDDGLSAIATKLGAPLMLDSYTTDIYNIVVAMPRIRREGHYTCNVRVEYDWKPPRCSSCKVFEHIHEECPKNTGAGDSSGNKKKAVELTIEVSNLNSFDVLNSVDYDVEFDTNKGTTNLVNNRTTSSGSSFMNTDNDGEFASNTSIGEKFNKIKRQIGEGKLRLLDNDGNSLVPKGIVESDSEVEVVFDETTNLKISTSGKDGSDKGYGTYSSLEQWRDSYPDNDDYDPYDDDMHENHDLSEHLQSICDDIYITVRGRKKK